MEVQDVFGGPAATLDEILDSRSRRAERQRERVERGCRCLVSFTMNIPGAVKQFPLSSFGFRSGLEALRRSLPSESLQWESVLEERTGSEGLFQLDADPWEVKRCTVRLEELHPLGRLFDLDVLDGTGGVISRSRLALPPRPCLLCGENAKICARSRTHSMEALRLRVAQLLDDYARDRGANSCASCATRALLYEVSTTPKPGLVDRNNSGAHRDMDFFTFLDSSAALSPWFREMFCIGWKGAGLSASELFQRLRFAGQEAQRDMLAATGGVNTHKGLIFSLGILCGALGKSQGALAPEGPPQIDQVLELCRAMGRCSLADFDADTGESAGLRCYRELHITGVRGEVADGFPAVMEIGLPQLRHWREQGLSLNDAAAMALLALLSHVCDTNLIRRGGAEEANRRRTQAGELFAAIAPGEIGDRLDRLDQEFIRNNLSPGGCADLLALSFMLYFLECDGHIQAEKTAAPEGNRSIAGKQKSKR